MKKYLSGLITGIALTTLVGSLVMGASAISSKMTIEVDPINIMVNGEIFEPKDANGNPVPVFAYKGTTMAPLRALAEAYGLEVGYDANSNMATVKESESKSTNVATVPEPTEAPVSTISEEWTDEDEAIYKQLTEGWEFKLMGEVSTASLEIDRAAYSATYTKGDFVFDWEAFEKAENFEKIALKLTDMVNETKQPNTTIVYGNGIMLHVYEGWAHL